MGGRRRAAIAVVALAALVTSACSDVLVLEVPSADDLQLAPRTPAVQSVVYDADGRQLAVLRREYREPVSLLEVPGHLVAAILTAEDRRFYDHTGVDARAILRAAIANHTTGRTQQGGSTITQQLVKNLYLPEAERTGATKLREAVLSRELERQRSKADILEDYLNTVYFGEGAHGVSAAAWTYFRAEVADLDLAQAALLAAIIRAPEAFAPTRAPDAARQRRDDVLWRMAEDGHIDPGARDRALRAPIEVEARPPAPATREPHFVDLVVRTLLADPRLGATEADRATRLYEGGLQVHTTLRADLQQLARDTLAHHLPDPEDPESAVVVVEPATGHVLAAVGNRAYDELQFDLATQARRQPGSTFKTFVLATAITEGWHPEDRLDGRQGEVVLADGRRWEVRNYDRRSYPDVSLAGATRASVNSAFARLGDELGLARIAGVARAMGISSTLPLDDPQITIGGGEVAITPLDLAAAYGTLANLGRHVPTTPIARIEDAHGDTVWVPMAAGEAALSPSAAHVTTEVLRDVVEHGTALAARVPGWEIAGKTGTTSDYADAWFAGYSPLLAAAVWMGHVEGRVPLLGVRGVPRVTGGTLPARIFADLMAAAHADREPVPFRLPDDEYVLVEIDPASGLRAAAWCPGAPQRLPRVLVPRETCPEPPPPPPPPAAPSTTPAAPAPGPSLAPTDLPDQDEAAPDEQEPPDVEEGRAEASEPPEPPAPPPEGPGEGQAPPTGPGPGLDAGGSDADTAGSDADTAGSAADAGG